MHVLCQLPVAVVEGGGPFPMPSASMPPIINLLFTLLPTPSPPIRFEGSISVESFKLLAMFALISAVAGGILLAVDSRMYSQYGFSIDLESGGRSWCCWNCEIKLPHWRFRQSSSSAVCHTPGERFRFRFRLRKNSERPPPLLVFVKLFLVLYYRVQPSTRKRKIKERTICFSFSTTQVKTENLPKMYLHQITYILIIFIVLYLFAFDRIVVGCLCVCSHFRWLIGIGEFCCRLISSIVNLFVTIKL